MTEGVGGPKGKGRVGHSSEGGGARRDIPTSAPYIIFAPPLPPFPPSQSFPRIKASLTRKAGSPKEIPIVTGFLGKGLHTGAITTLGRGGSDLSATVLGAALELEEVQVWKDVDGK